MALRDLLAMMRSITGEMPSAAAGLDEFAAKTDRIVSNASELNELGREARDLAREDQRILRDNIGLAREAVDIYGRNPNSPRGGSPPRSEGFGNPKNFGQQLNSRGLVGSSPPRGSYVLPGGSLAIPYDGGTLIIAGSFDGGGIPGGMGSGGMGGRRQSPESSGVSAEEVVSTMNEVVAEVRDLSKRMGRSREDVSQVEVSRVSPGDRLIVGELQTMQREIRGLRPKETQEASVEYRVEGLI